ncbi:chromosome transmission fidelity protein 18 homolog [Phoenix dactylifera]|uniref:Chromosome transmission fidelity protein 18 homolog n=1 Tax=Phoenix dactylifera TaxID=42345 RepID=A0A8B9A349_PHODC|nr:chromosome transmission fidelity protein 18 homolog [Phoenix dactylifera]
MDIPAPEELEWLETNAFLSEEEEDYMVVEEDAGRDQEEDLIEVSRRKAPDPATTIEIHTSKKRPRTDKKAEVEVLEGVLADNERGIRRRASGDDSDEEWLRYSPPKDVAAADAAPERDVAVLDVAEEKFISRFVSEIEGECIPVTGPCGDRVYAKMNSGEMGGTQRKLIREKPANGLLSEPISLLSRRAEQEALAKALQTSFDSPVHQIHSTSQTVNEQLWVEKYAPKSFPELLSDEQINREVLLWLKQWDSSVFGSQIRATSDDVLSALRQHSSVQHQKFSNIKSFFGKKRGAPFSNQNFKSSDVFDRENNNLKGASKFSSRKPPFNHPPEQKVLLLCGPPGLGKTTLAHVAAKHCGYRVVEINASDDRSTSTIESKILDVVQMNSIMPDSKPKCLVIDEIDGALGEGKGAVEVILKMLAAEKKSSAEKGNATQEAQPGKASSKKGRKAVALSRPVICICNDLYAPALRPLRQVAKVHTFVQPTVNRVVNRLKYICKKEGFRTSTIALSALAEYTECDIRSCLNTLQFLNKKKEALNFLEVGSQVIGQKDMSRSVFDVWKEILQKRKLKHERKSTSGCSGHGDFDYLYSLISNRGEYELTMDGIYENFLHLSYHDPLMQKTVQCLDVLGVSDSFLQYVMRTQKMSLHVHQPPVAITMSRLIAQVEKPKIEWPKTFQRYRAMLMEKKDLLKTWQNKIVPSISRHLSIKSFVQDVVSPFLHILAPPTLRPVALHLLSEKEKDDLAHLVDTMVSYSITYKNSKSEPSQKVHKYGAVPDASVLCFDPPVDDFVKFKDYQWEHCGLSAAMKQVLVHEVEKQRILRDSTGRSMNLPDGSSSVKQVSATINAEVIPMMNLSGSSSVDGSNKLNAALIQRQELSRDASKTSSEVNKKLPASGVNLRTPGNSKKSSSHSSSFFDRFRKGSNTDSKVSGDASQKAATTERDARPLLFKYNEGFTNAVKRPVRIRDLLI